MPAKKEKKPVKFDVKELPEKVHFGDKYRKSNIN